MKTKRPAKLSQSKRESSAVPWEEIEKGRYQPRRIRGSCVGRELG
jgi:hypothetical protein